MKRRLAILTLAVLGAWGQENPYTGSTPQGKATSDVMPLSLREAVTRGLKYNLGTVLAGEMAQMARGQRLVALSELLPHISARATESSQQLNLAAFGFPSNPGIPQIVGPFGVFDARGAVSQTVLNFRSMRNSTASVETQKAAELAVKDSRDTVALAVAALYLQASSQASRIEAAQAQVAAAEALYRQAVEFRAQGVVAGIDVLRAQVQLKTEQQRMIGANNAFEKSKLDLGRAIGLADGQQIRLTDAMPAVRWQAPEIETALGKAYQSRHDYRSQEQRVKAAELSRRAASAGYLPSVGFQGDYGTLGQSPVSMHGTFSAAISLNIPIFEGGKVKGEEAEAQSALARERARLEDLRGRIGYEIRGAMLDLKSAADLLDVSQSAVALAQQQEEQARDRFAAGVTDNLEVVQAQEAVARAREWWIGSLFFYNLARAQLARAMGGVESTMDSILTGEKP